MQIKVKKKTKDGLVRLETKADIKEVLMEEDILHESKESVSVCFKGTTSSGIIEMSPSEIERLYHSIQNKTIKGMRRLTGSWG